MHEIHVFNGIHFVKNPYRQGSYIREDIFARQFVIQCHARICCEEDDPRYGWFWLDTVLTLGECALIEQAILLAQARIHTLEAPEDTFGVEAISVAIMDRTCRTILTGKVRSRKIQWHPPAQTRQEEEAILSKIDLLKSQRSEELRADNYDSMRHLSEQISHLQGTLIHATWKTHAIAALAATQSSR